jgi:uncharacterized protein YjiS (DUF1127 family)
MASKHAGNTSNHRRNRPDTAARESANRRRHRSGDALATETAAKEGIMDSIRFSTVATHLADVLARAGLHNDLGHIIGRARALVRWQVRVIERRRRVVATRMALEALDDRTLKDIGLHRAELRAVAAGVRGGERVRRDAQAQLRQAA